MFSSAKHQRNHRVSAPNKNKILNKVPSISSSSSPSHSQVQKRSLITMEEVWKDINLASIHHLNHHSQHPQHNHEPRFRSHNQNPNSIFQDFLNRPLNQEPTIPTSLSGDTTTVTALFSSSPLAPPATVLSLNSSACFEFLDNEDPLVTPNSNRGKGVAGVRNEQARFTDSSITNGNTLYEPLSAHCLHKLSLLFSTNTNNLTSTPPTI